MLGLRRPREGPPPPAAAESLQGPAACWRVRSRCVRRGVMDHRFARVCLCLRLQSAAAPHKPMCPLTAGRLDCPHTPAGGGVAGQVAKPGVRCEGARPGFTGSAGPCGRRHPLPGLPVCRAYAPACSPHGGGGGGGAPEERPAVAAAEQQVSPKAWGWGQRAVWRSALPGEQQYCVLTAAAAAAPAQAPQCTAGGPRPV